MAIKVKKTVCIFVLVLFTLLIARGFYRLCKQSTLVGKYEADSGYKGHIDRYFLELREDGTYSQKIIDYKGKEYTNNGKWKYNRKQGEHTIEARDFLALDGISGKPRYSGLRIAPVKRSVFRGTTLWFAEWLIFSYSAPLKKSIRSHDVKVLWQKEFIADSNLGYMFRPVMFSQADNRLLLTGASYKIAVPPPKEFEEFWLWEIDPDGNMLRNTTFDNTDGELNPYMGFSPSCLQLTGDGNIQVLIRNSSSRALSIMKVAREGKVISISPPVFEPNYPTRSFKITGMISCPDNNSFVIGHQRSSKSMVIKLDPMGKCLWKKTYALADRMYNFFTEVLPDTGGSGFIAGGFSTGYQDRDYFILRIDSDGNVLSKISFPCHDPGDEGTWPHLFRMDSGNIMAANDTNDRRHDESEIMIRMYTSDLKLLFKKQLGKLAQEKYQESYRIEPVAGGGFALIDDSNHENLVLHLYDGEGNESCCVPLNIASPYFYQLEYGCKRLFIVMPTAARGVKIIALEIN